jgi:hypothetical protein
VPRRLRSPRPSGRRTSRAWWILPIAVLSLIVLATLAIILNSWYRNRRAEQEYLRAHGGS